MDETAELAKAISAAVNLTDESDTLIVVTSDHSHAMSMNGYARRGNAILGKTLVKNLHFFLSEDFILSPYLQVLPAKDSTVCRIRL